MTQREALHILKQISRDPSISDQFTEEEIEHIENIANR